MVFAFIRRTISSVDESSGPFLALRFGAFLISYYNVDRFYHVLLRLEEKKTDQTKLHIRQIDSLVFVLL